MPVFFIVGSLVRNMWWGIGGLFAGFLLGRYISILWHDGKIQIFLYSHLSFLSKKLPASWEKRLM